MLTSPLAGRLRQILVLLLSLSAILAVGRSGFAQGTDGLVPDPISSRDLRLYAERLELNPSQRLALSELHVGYREKYRELRYADIQDLFTRLEAFEPMRMPALRDVRTAVDARRRIMRMIEDLDRSFLEEVQALLTEEQVHSMPRVLRAREKQRYTLPFYSELGKIELLDLLDDLNLTEPEQQQLASLIEQYEIASTAGARTLHDEIIRVALAVLEKLEELGINEDSFNSPLAMMASMTAIDQALKDAGKDLQAAITNQRRQTERYMRQFGDALSPDRADNLEQAYLRAAYPRIYPDRETTEPMFRAALALDDLSEDQQRALTEQFERFQERHRRVSQEMRQITDERFQSIISVDPTGWESHWRQTRELRNRRNQLNSQMRDGIGQALSEDQHARAQRQATRLAGPGHRFYSEAATRRGRTITYETPDGEIVTMRADELEAGQTVVTVDGRVVEGAGDAGERRAQEARQAAVPAAHIGPLTTADVSDLARLMRLDRTQTQAALALHEDYLDRFQELREERAEAFSGAPRGRWSGRQLDSAALARLSRDREAFRQAVAQLDDEYFEEVEFLLSPEQAQRLDAARLSRRLDVLGSRAQPFWSPARVQGEVNLIKLLDRLALNEAQLDAALPALREYAERSLPHKQAAYDLALEEEQIRRRIMSEAQPQLPGDWMRASERIREQTRSVSSRADQARADLLESQEQALAALREALPATQVGPLMRLFYETAYPSVYPDPTQVDAVFDEAMGLRDLTTPQYEALQAAFDRYADEHGRICGQMILTARDVQLVGDNWYDPNTMRERARHERMLATLRFDRDELNALYRLRIEAILTPEQVARMRTLRREASR